jgi:hypothetical protein
MLKTDALVEAVARFVWLDDTPLTVERQWLAQRARDDIEPAMIQCVSTGELLSDH